MTLWPIALILAFGVGTRHLATPYSPSAGRLRARATATVKPLSLGVPSGLGLWKTDEHEAAALRDLERPTSRRARMKSKHSVDVGVFDPLPNDGANERIDSRLYPLTTESANLEGAEDRFWRTLAQTGAPLVDVGPEPRSLLVTFVFRGDPETKSVSVLTPMEPQDASATAMRQLHGTNTWYRSYVLRDDARLSYTFWPNRPDFTLEVTWTERDSWLDRLVSEPVPDPFNSQAIPRWRPYDPPQGLHDSVLSLPQARPEPWLEARMGSRRGSVWEHRFASKTLDNERRVWVYTPAGYSQQGPGLPLVIAFDGEAFSDVVPALTILDNLVERGSIPPLIFAGLCNPTRTSRRTEYPCNDYFLQFLAGEIMPWLQSNYSVTSNPERVVLAGISYGGLAAAFAALQRPDLFGNVLSMSGWYAWAPAMPASEMYKRTAAEGEFLARTFASAPRAPVRFWLDVGLMEDKLPVTVPQLAANRHFRNVLMAKGYDIHYEEYNGGHQHVIWRSSLPLGLEHLLRARVNRG